MRLRQSLAAATAALTLGGTAFAVAAGTAHAAPITLTAVTQVSNRPDNGNGGTWAYDTMARTLTVTVAATQSPADTANHLTDYTAVIRDKGTFSAIQGALAPNQSAANLKVQSPVTGTVTGTYNLTVTAPEADTLTGSVPASEDDNFSTATNGFVSTGDWAKQAFASSTGVNVTGGAYNWTYGTACEQWVDSSANGDGNQPADGNITGKACPPPPPADAPYVLHGRWTARTASSAQVTWDNSKKGWPSGNKCNEVYITGYGFGPIGDFAHAHIGYTCDNGAGHDTGYLRGLLPDHTYALRVLPATGTYGNHHPIPGAGDGYVDVFTLAAFGG